MIRRLARTDLTKRAVDVLAYFDRPGTSNGPTEAINGRLEHLRGSALGFRNLTNYSARSLLESGAFRSATCATSSTGRHWSSRLRGTRRSSSSPRRPWLGSRTAQLAAGLVEGRLHGLIFT